MSEYNTEHFKVFLLEPTSLTYKRAAVLFGAILNKQEREGIDYCDAAFYLNMHSALREQKPEFLQTLGLLSPSEQVTLYTDGYPRTYRTYPTIYVLSLSQEKIDFYLYAPVDYKGAFFTPDNAKLLDKEHTSAVGHGLFGGGWNDPPFVFHMPRTGVALPVDFDAQKHLYLTSSYTLHHAYRKPDQLFDNINLYNWLQQNDGDKMDGHIPPPPPRDLMRLFVQNPQMARLQKPQGPQ